MIFDESGWWHRPLTLGLLVAGAFEVGDALIGQPSVLEPEMAADFLSTRSTSEPHRMVSEHQAAATVIWAAAPSSSSSHG